MSQLRVLMITSEWPTPELPNAVPFVVSQVNSLRRAGVDVDVFHFRGGKRPANYLKAWKEAHARLRQERYDLVHAQWGQSAVLALFPKVRPLVITYRGSDLEGIVDNAGRYTRAGQVLVWMSRLAARMADERIVVSPSLAQRLPRPAHLIPSGINRTLFRPMPQAEARQALGWDLDRRYVLFGSSRANPVKRYALAEAAVSRLPADLGVTLVTVGQEPFERMPIYMNAADALVMTSFHEGSPNVVKEALACNLPVVSTDVGDVRQRIGGLEGCVVCADDRPETVAAGLAQVLAQPRRLDAQALADALDERALTQQVIEIYRSVVSRRS